MTANQQGVKRFKNVSTQPNIGNKKCVQQSHVTKQGVGIKTCKNTNKQISVTGLHPTVKCSNKFAILSVDINVLKDHVNAQETEVLTVTDPSQTKGESSGKITQKLNIPHLSAQSSNKYDLELRSKPKHTYIINSAKIMIHSRPGIVKIPTSMVLFPWRTFAARIMTIKNCNDSDLIAIHNRLKQQENSTS